VKEARGAHSPAPAPGPFHCVACKTYVTGTPSGHCPRCGWIPPAAPAAQDPPPVLRGLPIALAVAAVIAALALVAVR